MPDVYTWIAWAVAILAFALGVQILGVGGAVVAIVLAILALTGLAWFAGAGVRSRLRQREPRFRPTDEVFRDPASGRLTRVHVDPSTGERRYWTED
jgi:hypothetical protein